MGKQAGVYFLWGAESYLIDLEIKKLIGGLTEESGMEPEIVSLDPDQLTPLVLAESLEFSSLFSLSRVLIIRRPPWLAKGKKKGIKTEEYSRVLEAYLNQPSTGQFVIMTAEESPSGNPLAKLLEKKAFVIHVVKPDARALTIWLDGEFRSRGRTASSEVIGLLAQSGQDMYYLINLIDKICLTTRGTIDTSQIGEELQSGEEIRVFKLSDALLRKNLAAALKAYRQLLAQGGSETFFLYIVVRQIVQMAKVKHYLEQGLSLHEIEGLTAMKSFAVRTKADQSRRFTWEAVRKALDACLEADIRMKTSRQDQQLIMEELLIRICG